MSGCQGRGVGALTRERDLAAATCLPGLVTKRDWVNIGKDGTAFVFIRQKRVSVEILMR